jgi:hypothetical protein
MEASGTCTHIPSYLLTAYDASFKLMDIIIARYPENTEFLRPL